MYTAPSSLPRTPAALAVAMLSELGAIALESREPSANSLLLKALAAAPAKLNEGAIALADGTNWNPGHGAGPYVYQSGEWLPLYGYVPAFTAPTLLSAWANFGGTGSPAGYRKDAFGVVELRGNIAGGAIGNVAFVLPFGYRPASGILQVPAVSYNGAAYVLGVALIYTNGDVVPAAGHTAFFSLDGIKFAAV